MTTEEKTPLDHASIGMPVTEELPGFRSEEMTACDACGRKNAPDRPRCMYCGAELHVSGDRTIKVSGRVLESWENGFNVVVTGGQASSAAVDAEIRLDSELLRSILENRWRVPLRRVETHAEAEYLRRKLNETGIESRIVADEELSLPMPATRIRGAEMAADSLCLRHFNTGETSVINRDSIVVVIAGTIVSSRTDTMEKRKRGTSELLDETQATSLESLVDIYTQSNDLGYRIAATGFDFSCLGNEKTMLAAENMQRLVERLREFVGMAKFIGGYDVARATLDEVWPPDVKRESRGMMRSGFGRKDLARTESISNLEQFTRFSRLQRLLI